MTHPNASTALAEVIVDELLRGGVRQLVLSPGSRSAAIAITAGRRSDMSVTVSIDERSAAFFALGVGKVTGIAAAVLTTSGSAVGHLFPAVIEADTAGVPLILLTADRPPELHGVGANQTIEQSNIFGPAVRLALELGPAEHAATSNAAWRSAVSQAIDAATDGPVHINVAFREPVVPETDDGRDRDQPFAFPTDGREGGKRWSETLPPELVTMHLADLWTGPERGVVVVGEAPFASLAAVDRLAATLGWPLIAEPTAGGRPAQAITTAHHVLSDPELAARLRPEAAIVIGRANLSRPVSTWLADVPRLVADPRISRAADPNCHLATGWPVVDSVGGRSGDWRRLWLRVEDVGRTALDAFLDGSGLSEPRIARDTADAIPAGGILFSASSMPIRDLNLAMRSASATVMSNRGASGIDGLVSSVLGVASAHPGPVVALTGDLALLHDGNGFLVEPRPDVVFVVVNNDGGGIFSFLPQARHPDVFERIFATPHGRSFEQFAAFHGIRHQHVTDVGVQVRGALDAGGTWVLEATTDRQTNPGVHTALTHAVVDAVRDSVEG